MRCIRTLSTLVASILVVQVNAMNLSPCGYRLKVKAGLDERVMNQRFAQSIGDQRFFAVDRVMKRHRENSALWRGTIFAPGVAMPFKKTYFEVVDVVGVGSEANLFLVKTPEGLRTAKVYRRDKLRYLEEEVEQLNHLSQNGVPVLKPQDVDPENGIVLFPYKEGFDVRNAQANGNKLGLTPVELVNMDLKAGELRDKVTAYFEKFPDRPPFTPEDFNMVYDVNTGEVILVDRR